MEHQKELTDMVTRILKRYVGNQQLREALHTLDTNLVLLQDQSFQYELHADGRIYLFHPPEPSNQGIFTYEQAAQHYVSHHAPDKPIKTIQSLLDNPLAAKVETIVKDYIRCQENGGRNENLSRI